jgi:uncharacterized protein YraI
MIRSKAILMALVSIATLGATFAAPGSASADTGTQYKTTASPCLRTHSGPDAATFVEGCLPYGTRIHIACQYRNDHSPTADVNGSTIWDSIDWDSQDGDLLGFFVSDYYTTTPVYNGFTPGIPRC